MKAFLLLFPVFRGAKTVQEDAPCRGNVKYFGRRVGLSYSCSISCKCHSFLILKSMKERWEWLCLYNDAGVLFFADFCLKTVVVYAGCKVLALVISFFLYFPPASSSDIVGFCFAN